MTLMGRPLIPVVIVDRPQDGSRRLIPFITRSLVEGGGGGSSGRDTVKGGGHLFDLLTHFHLLRVPSKG